MLCQDCCAFHIARFRRLDRRLELSSASHWRAQASLLWWVVVGASRGEPQVALISQLSSSLPLPSPSASPLSPSFPVPPRSVTKNNSPFLDHRNEKQRIAYIKLGMYYSYAPFYYAQISLVLTRLTRQSCTT